MQILMLMSIFLLRAISCDRILIVVGHFSATSHKKSILPFAEELGKQGHDVHFWNVEYNPTKLKGRYFKDNVLVVDSGNRMALEVLKYENSTAMQKAYWLFDKTTALQFNVRWFYSMAPCKAAVENYFVKLKQLAQDGWDFILVESFFAPCAWLIRSLAPSGTIFISWSSTAFMPYTTAARAHAHNIIANPHPFSTIDYDARKFLDRLKALYDYMEFHVLHTSLNYQNVVNELGEYFVDFSTERQEKLARFAFSIYPEILNGEIPRNTDARSFGGGAGSCMEPNGTLSRDYRDFLEDPASKGTIIAAFGHHVSWEYAPSTFVDSFVYAFSQLKDYRIIWQFPGGKEAPTLRNVKIVKWLPQTALLAHPKTKVFITHLGVKSMIEGVCAGVPILACPLCAEQQRNAANLVKRGMSIAVDKARVQPEKLYEALVSILGDEQFKIKALKWAQYLKKGYAMNPVEEGAFWLRFTKKDEAKLDKFIYNKGRWLGYMSYFCVDVVIFIAVVGVVLGLAL